VKKDKLINISIVIIMLLRIIVGSLVNWIFHFNYYVVYLSSLEKLITVVSYLIGVLVIGIIIIVRKFLKLYYLFEVIYIFLDLYGF